MKNETVVKEECIVEIYRGMQCLSLLLIREGGGKSENQTQVYEEERKEEKNGPTDPTYPTQENPFSV